MLTDEGKAAKGKAAKGKAAKGKAAKGKAAKGKAAKCKTCCCNAHHKDLDSNTVTKLSQCNIGGVYRLSHGLVNIAADLT